MGINVLPDRLVSARKRKGYSRKELSKLFDIPYRTLTNYENGEREPGHSFIIKAAKEFGVTTDYLLGLSDSPSPVTTVIQPKQKTTTSEPDTAEAVATKYKRLDRHGKQVVCAVITEEERRMAEAHADEPDAEIVELFPVNSYLQPASAGCGDYTDDDCFEVVDLVKRPPNGTSFLVTVDGDSMEPTYHDGEKVFVRAQETLEVGEIGIVAFGSDVYIKEQGTDCLISHNKKYSPRTPEDGTVVRVIGKVLGVCTEDYFRKTKTRDGKRERVE